MMSVNDSDFQSCGESSEDSYEELKEIESRFYSVIHYNNLSESANLPEGFHIDISKSNELIVSLGDGHNSMDSYVSERKLSSDNNDACDEGDSVIINDVESNCVSKNTKPTAEVVSLCDSLGSEQNDDDDIVIIGSHPSIIDNKVKDCKSFKSNNCSIANNKIGSPTMNLVNSNLSVSLPITSSSSIHDVQHTKNQSTDVIGSNNITTNIIGSKEAKRTEEIVISSDENQSHINNKSSILSKNKGKRKKRKSKAKRIENNCPKKWSSAMVKFYSKISRKKLNFDSLKLRRNMRETVGKEGWFLNQKDLSGERSKRNRNRCPRCRQFDHDLRHCKERPKPVICHMCGEIGHKFNRCPFRKCLTCGSPNSTFVQMCTRCLKSSWSGQLFCRICNSTNHQENLCPDVWRSFHATTKEGPLVIPLTVKSPKKLVCCNCAQEGHLEYECPEVYNSLYLRDYPFVHNYISVAQLFASNEGNLTINIKLTTKEKNVLDSEDGFLFLQNLSNTIKARLELVIELPFSFIAVNGSQTQCTAVLDQVRLYVETKLPIKISSNKNKRKRPSKKRRTL